MGLLRKIAGLVLLSLWCFQGAVLASAADDQEMVHKDPHALVSESVYALLARFQALNEQGDATEEQYLRVVKELVGPVVDFELIAKRVMSRYYKMASKEQMAQFVDVFRETLLSTYSKGMVVYANHKVEMLPFEGVRKKGNRARASVEMEVYGRSGKVYPLTYAMYLNDEQQWKLENLVLNGVNIGLTLRNQFNEAMRQQKGNIDQVIAHWNTGAKQAQVKSEVRKSEAKQKLEEAALNEVKKEVKKEEVKNALR